MLDKRHESALSLGMDASDQLIFTNVEYWLYRFVVPGMHHMINTTVSYIRNNKQTHLVSSILALMKYGNSLNMVQWFLLLLEPGVSSLRKSQARVRFTQLCSVGSEMELETI